jgi:hypothetical protein
MSKLISSIKFKGESIPIVTIPKGTVLFRLIYDREDHFSDFGGIKLLQKTGQDKYCLNRQSNVFFFPYPYAIDFNKYVTKDKVTNRQTIVYVTTTDVKLGLFVSPSKKTRKDHINKSILQSCDKFQLCGDFQGHSYDPCFEDDFIEAYPEIVGSMTLSFLDMNTLRANFWKEEVTDFRKFITFIREHGKNPPGVPDMAIYPRRKRSMEEITTNKPVDGFTWIREHQSEFNYFPLFVFPHLGFEKDAQYTFLEKAFSPEGYYCEDTKMRYHFTIDKRTYFYMLQEYCEEKTLKHCLLIKEKNKLKILQEMNPELVFTVSPPKPPKYIGPKDKAKTFKLKTE